MKKYAHDQQILTLATQGVSNAHIASVIGMSPSGVGRVRQRLGITPYTRSRTIDEIWDANTQPTSDGHLIWTGPRATAGHPILKAGNKVYQVTRVAYRRRTGRDPEGSARPGCGVGSCVHPDHVQDTAERQRVHEQMRYLRGLPPPPQACGNGHTHAEHGRFDSDGCWYCAECTREKKRRQRARDKAAA